MDMIILATELAVNRKIKILFILHLTGKVFLAYFGTPDTTDYKFVSINNNNIKWIIGPIAYSYIIKGTNSAKGVRL